MFYSKRLAAVIIAAILLPLFSFSQNQLAGTVRNAQNEDLIPAVSVTVKGTSQGTSTDDNGHFSLSVSNLPAVLLFTSVGFESKELTVFEASSSIQVVLTPGVSLGSEVVVSATRVAERLLESPVSIERINSASIRNAAVPNYYESLMNLKGVDVATSGMLFRTISTRGFNGSGNLRFNQLVDGIDNQAPGLNFSVGNIVGVTELDVDNMELQQGASSALYGSGGMNGTLLITSKNPFDYQGLSFQVKQGIMHVDEAQRSRAPYHDIAVRYAKKIGQKFAFKISSQYIAAKDWQAQDFRNLQRNNVFSSLKEGNRQSDPNYDGVNVFGDEASTNMHSIAQAAVFRATQLALPQIIQQIRAVCGCEPTLAMINAALGTFLTTNQQVRPFYLGLQNNVFLSGSSPFVSRTGYNEEDLVDYDTYNLKVSAGAFYRFRENLEASLMGYWGTGTTVYTGADRYALQNLVMGQYKAELKSKNWFLRGYTIQENAGDSYTATTSALFVNRAWRSDADWFGLYSGTFAGARLQGLPEAQAHAAARAAADQGRYLPGSAEFNTAFENAKNTSINKGGAKFEDETDMYHFEGQYNLTEKVKVIDLLVGASYRLFHLNSKGTIFADTTGPINISEVGGYVQVQKKLFQDVLKLTGSLRYDKNENFDGRFTPRATALVQVAKDNNVRISFQTAYRFPSTQDQYINLLTGGSNRLIGGLPQFETFFRFNTSPGYTAESITAYRNSFYAGAPNPALLKQATFQTVNPETASSYELGYRGLVTPKFLIDAYVYYSRYKNFIGRVAVGRGQSESTNPTVVAQELASPFTTNNYSFVTNVDTEVKAYGWGVSLSYQLGNGFELNGNVSSDKLRDLPENFVSFFNTPELRYNIGFGNTRIGKHWGFNLIYRWQDDVYWEGTFGTGDVPSYGTLDAQINYRLPQIKSIIKVGASNVFNDYYRSAFGNPEVGGLYYISFGYNLF
jgi:outer membrane receptor protein involved in Fe transport